MLFTKYVKYIYIIDILLILAKIRIIQFLHKCTVVINFALWDVIHLNRLRC